MFLELLAATTQRRMQGDQRGKNEETTQSEIYIHVKFSAGGTI